MVYIFWTLMTMYAVLLILAGYVIMAQIALLKELNKVRQEEELKK